MDATVVQKLEQLPNLVAGVHSLDPVEKSTTEMGAPELFSSGSSSAAS